MNQQEIYLPVTEEDYRDRYMVSNKGNVRSKYKILATTKSKEALRVGLSFHGNQKNFKVHDLVAKAFIPNPENFKCVTHLDGNKSNNSVENLMWCTQPMAVDYAKKVLGKTRPTVAVRQLDRNTNVVVAEFDSIADAERETGINNSHISSVCKGKRNTAGNFKWEHINYIPDIEAPPGKQFENYSEYVITSDGQVYSHNLKRFRILRKEEDGYVIIDLSANGIRKDFYVHVLVAKLFLESIEGKKEVNHKDKNKTNNNVENLEWVTPSENMFHYQQTVDKISNIPVIQYDNNNRILERYNNIIIAVEQNDIRRTSIRYACDGIYQSSGGFVWKYADDTAVTNPVDVNISENDNEI